MLTIPFFGNHRLPIAATLLAAGAAAKVYFDHATTPDAAKAAADEEREKRNAMLLESYGSGESLEELEKAVRFYESRK